MKKIILATMLCLTVEPAFATWLVHCEWGVSTTSACETYYKMGSGAWGWLGYVNVGHNGTTMRWSPTIDPASQATIHIADNAGHDYTFTFSQNGETHYFGVLGNNVTPPDLWYHFKLTQVHPGDDLKHRYGWSIAGPDANNNGEFELLSAGDYWVKEWRLRHPDHTVKSWEITRWYDSDEGRWRDSYGPTNEYGPDCWDSDENPYDSDSSKTNQPPANPGPEYDPDDNRNIKWPATNGPWAHEQTLRTTAEMLNKKLSDVSRNIIEGRQEAKEQNQMVTNQLGQIIGLTNQLNAITNQGRYITNGIAHLTNQASLMNSNFTQIRTNLSFDHLTNVANASLSSRAGLTSTYTGMVSTVAGGFKQGGSIAQGGQGQMGNWTLNLMTLPGGSQLSMDLNITHHASLAAVASIVRTTITWIATFLCILFIGNKVNEMVRGAVSTGQTQSAASIPGASSGLALLAAAIIAVAILAAPGILFAVITTGGPNSALGSLANPFDGIGGPVGQGIWLLDQFVPVALLIADAIWILLVIRTQFIAQTITSIIIKFAVG